MKKNKWIGPLLIAVFLVGLSLLLYPSFSDYWNSTRQTQWVADYSEHVEQLDDGQMEAFWVEARAYNKQLKTRRVPYVLTDEQRERYIQVLDAAGSGVMGYVDIPSINVTLPIYHGTSDQVLQRAVGHLEWSFLPIGGESTHSIVSGHRGLPSAKLFTDLDKLMVGDLFMFQVLDETLTYEVDQILTVNPDDVAALAPEDGKDLCTLVTCTPYGVNTHRLLVRGHRIENLEAAKVVRVVSEAMQIEPMIVAPVVAIPLLLLLLMIYTIDESLRKRKKQKRIPDTRR